MRIKISCDIGQGVTLPINYNHLLSGVVYQFLKQSDPEYAHFLHETGYERDRRGFKLFTFSQLMAKQRVVQGARIRFEFSLTWYVSSPQQAFLENFAASLMQTGVLQIADKQLRVRDVTVPRAPRFDRQMRFRCLAAIVMSTKRERDGQLVMHYCRANDPQFSELVRQNLIRKYEAIHGHAPRDQSFAMAFDQAYIAKRKGRVSRLVDFKGVKIRGVLCPFQVIGAPELIRVGYECGFGDKNSVGFGMAEVVRKPKRSGGNNPSNQQFGMPARGETQEGRRPRNNPSNQRFGTPVHERNPSRFD